MSKTRIIYLSIAVIAIISLAFVFRKKDTADGMLVFKVKKGAFEVLVYSTGELESENSTDIMAPEKFQDRNLRIRELTITDLVTEGTRVDSGDYVATLDKKEVEEQLKSVQDEMEKTYSEMQDAMVDSSLNLSNQRDQIMNASLDLAEKRIVVEESIYESPSVQKKALMDLNKAERKYEQEVKAYELKKQQEENKVKRKFIDYRQQKDRMEDIEELYNALEVYSPKAGIITYKKYRWGGIVKTGSKINPYNPIIATIPDMSNMTSKTFINEIDISKVKVGQKVKIGIDAFPQKELSGEVVTIANIGQAMPNSDAKVFEVKIKVFGEDPVLKPAMTTSNTIVASNSSDTLFIPSDAVFKNDSVQFVYVNGKREKQIVALGDANENFVLVKEGLTEGDEICLNIPEDEEKWDLTGFEIYANIKRDKEIANQNAEEAARQFQLDKNKPKMKMGSMPQMGSVVISK